jgi:hypothetical protein
MKEIMDSICTIRKEFRNRRRVVLILKKYGEDDGLGMDNQDLVKYLEEIGVSDVSSGIQF